MRKCIANENTARLTKYKVGDEVKESYAVCHVLVSLGNARWEDDDAPKDAFTESGQRRRGRPTNAERAARQAAAPREPQNVGAVTTRDYPSRDE